MLAGADIPPSVRRKWLLHHRHGSVRCGQLVVKRNMFTFSLCCPQQLPYQIKQLRNTAMIQWPLCVCVISASWSPWHHIGHVRYGRAHIHMHTHTYIYVQEHTHTHTHLRESDMPIAHGSAVPYPALSTSSSASDIILLTDSRDMCRVNGSEPDRYWERRYRRLY